MRSLLSILHQRFLIGVLGWTFAATFVVGADRIVGRPLADRGSRGATMFAELPAEQTGIVVENRYADPEMWGKRFKEFSFGSIGTGIAVGDYDADGKPDIFVVSKTERARLFRNLGGFRFADVTDAAGLPEPTAGWSVRMKSLLDRSAAAADTMEAWKQGAAFADVNNDGRLDLYVCRFGAPNWLFINQGDGTFKEEAAARGLDVSDASGIGAFCDFDRDGSLDVYLQTNMLDGATNPEGQRDYLFRNQGDGTFMDVTERAGITGKNLAHSATWWDYNQDGWPDLYVANDFGPADKLYRNNRDGTFTDVIHQTVPYMPLSAMGADLGDVNNDGLIDLLVGDMAASTHEKDHRGMAYLRKPSGPAVQDRKLAPQYSRNALFINTGTGHFLEAARLAGLAATDWTWAMRLEDLDNDGRLDVYVTNGMNREHNNEDLREQIYRTESPAERIRLMKASPPQAERNMAFRNRGELEFENIGATWGLDQMGVSFGAAMGDFDGDGDLDIVYANYEAGVTLLRNDSDSGHRITLALNGTRSNRFGVGALVTAESASGIQVRQLVLARGYLSTSEPVVHFGLGTDDAITRLTVAWPSGHHQSFENVRVDHHLVVTEPSGPTPPEKTDRAAVPVAAFSRFAPDVLPEVTAREGAGVDSNAQDYLPRRFDRLGPSVAVGDLTGRGFEDVVMGGTTDTPAQILLSGTKHWSPLTFADSSGRSKLDDGPLLLFHANADEHLDLLITKAGSGRPAGSPDYQPRLMMGDGRGGFGESPADALPALAISVGAAVAADWNRDGRLDAFIGGRTLPGKYPLSPRSALLRNDGGKLVDVTEELAPALRDIGMVTAALWTDVDVDGWIDLLIALEWGGVRFFRNTEGKGFEDRSREAGFDAAGTGWWTSLTSADFNGDGRLDYVAGNVGLNTQYRASKEHPALLYYGRMQGGGAAQLIEAHFENERAYPWRTLKDLGAKIPAVLKKFPRHNDYARATLDEVFGKDRLAAAERFAATELRSGVFLSDGLGGFSFVPLPRIAQIAPAQGVVAADFDGDGRADIYVAQNSYAPPPEIGWFGGGLSQLLRGDGKGGFTPVPAAESGLIVPGDAKALGTLDPDRDGWPDFFVSRNDDSSLAFRNTSREGRNSFRVELVGAAGNPKGVGSQVTVTLNDGSTQTAEISAGSGYYSQSSPVCFFGFATPNAPRSLRVRWPSGGESTHTVEITDGTMIVREPLR